jgi:uncharacterized protein (TIGR02757 family)
MSDNTNLKQYLDELVTRYNRPAFIENDPISLPHQFSKLQDIEMVSFWVSMLAWGQRKTIIEKSKQLLALMDNAPHDFVLQHQPQDLKPFLAWKHRTFQATDTLYFLDFFQRYYKENDTLETAFSQFITPDAPDVRAALVGFHHLFFQHENAPDRTRKHVATPERASTCKRLNMFLRWMVRRDAQGVDFGLWQQIQPRQLLMPLDVHVDRVARHFGLIMRKQTDWLTVQELTQNLRAFDADDPVRYDFALFGFGLEGGNALKP